MQVESINYFFVFCGYEKEKPAQIWGSTASRAGGGAVCKLMREARSLGLLEGQHASFCPVFSPSQRLVPAVDTVQRAFQPSFERSVPTTDSEDVDRKQKPRDKESVSQ